MASNLPVLYRAPKSATETIVNSTGAGLYRHGPLPDAINANQNQILFYYRGKLPSLTNAQQFLFNFQNQFAYRLRSREERGSIGLTVHDGSGNQSIVPAFDGHTQGDDIEVWILYDAINGPQAYETGHGFGMNPLANTADKFASLPEVNNVGVFDRGHANPPGFTHAHEGVERAALWFGTTADLTDEAVRTMIADPDRYGEVGGVLALDIHGTAEEFNQGHLRQGALRVWETGTGTFTPPNGAALEPTNTLINDPGVGLYRRGALPEEINSAQTQVLMYYKGKAQTEANDFVLTFQDGAGSLLSIAKTSGSRVGLWVKDGVNTDKLSPLLETLAGDDVEIFLVHDANGASQCWVTGQGGGLLSYDSTSTITIPLNNVDNVGVLGRGHGSAVPAFTDAVPSFERAALWFGTAPDLNNADVRAAIADPSRHAEIGGILAADVHGSLDELNRGQMRQGALRLWETGANEFALPASGTSELTGAGLQVTPELGQGVVTPTYNLTGSGLLVTPELGQGVVTPSSPAATLSGAGLSVTPELDQGVVTPSYSLTGSDLAVTPQIGQGVVTPTYNLTGAGLQVTPMVGMGSLSLTPTLAGMGLAVTPQIDQGVVTPTYTLTGSDLQVTPELGQGVVTASSPVVTLTGSGLSVTPELDQGVLTPTYNLTGAGLEVTPMVGMGSLSLSVTLTGMGLAATPQVDQGVVTPTYNLSGSGLVVTPEIEQGEVVPTYM
ncbi:hypothetical protein DL239_21385, partial [Sedimentitalea sp. CY04]